MDTIAEDVSARNILLRQLAHEGRGGKIGVSGAAMMEAPLGFLLGHPGVGAALGMGGMVSKGVQSAVYRPAATAKALLGFQRMVTAVSTHINEAAEAFVESRPMTALGRTIPRVIAPSTISVINAANASDRRKAYEARAREVAKLGDPESVAKRAGAATEGLAEHAPAAAQQAAAYITNAAAILNSSLPRPLVEHNALAPTKREASANISDHDLRVFGEVDAAIQDPLRIMDQLVQGRAPHPQAVQAVQMVHPTTWDAMAGAFIHAAASSTKGLNPRARTLASITFGIDATPAYGGASLNARLGRSRQAAQQPPGSPGRREGGGRRGSRRGASDDGLGGPTKLNRLLER